MIESIVNNYIIVGDNTFTINADDILDLTVTRSNSLMLDEMSSDVCEATVYSEANDLDDLEYGTKMTIVRDIAIQDVFYLSKVTRIKADQYKIEMTSFFGVLDSEIFYGGYYTGETLKNVVESIIQTNGLDTTTTDHSDVLDQIQYDDGVDELPVFGWIKVVSKREALHQVLFSRGISMKRSSDGAIRFSVVYDTEPISISEERIYENNDTKYLPNVSDVEIEEHTYTDDLEKKIEILFENKQATEVGKTYIAVYNCDSPVLRPVQANGLALSYHNCNAAVVTGVGTISGYPSVHSTTMIKEKIREIKGETISIRGCTMITISNSAFILDRLKSYYLSSQTEVTTSIVREDERTGSHVSVVNSFGERVSGFITHMTETYSGIVKAACKIITGYHPIAPEIGFNHSVVLSGSGGWVVPASVYLKEEPIVKVVLVGGGTGGDGGTAGGDGQKGYPDGNGHGGAAGESGDGGSGGKIYTVTIDNPNETLYYECGVGGTGGNGTTSTSTHNHGVEGTDTVLIDGSTNYSSASGERNDSGVMNQLTGMQYGLNYKVSRTGQYFKTISRAGEGGWHLQYAYATGETGVGFTFNLTETPPTYKLDGWLGGESGKGGYGEWHYTGGQNYHLGYVSGGAGGGGTVGAEGKIGGNAQTGYAGYREVSGIGGTGGNGATPSVTPPKPNEAKPTGILPFDDGGFGNGGFGGYGGGGGGAGGAASTFSYEGFRGYLSGSGGKGGHGGKGGNGGDGCIIIYY